MEVAIATVVLLFGLILSHVRSDFQERRRRRLESRRLTISLVEEVQNTLLLAAVTGSVANALATGRYPELREVLTAYLPPDPVVLPANAWQLNEFDREMSASLMAFYARLQFAKRATTAYSKLRGNDQSFRPMSFLTLAEAWKGVTAQGRLLGYYFDRLVTDPNEHKLSTQNSALRILLDRVCSGGHPCVEEDGFVNVPGWAERRQQPRRSLEMAGAVRVGGKTHRVTLKDVSSGGLGLEGNVDIKEGDRIVFALDSGREFVGTAVWTRHGKFGIKLADNLPATDPLVSAGGNPNC